ncbi:MAG: cytochrome oxidase small assembly protein [Burkholderiales bacterium]
MKREYPGNRRTALVLAAVALAFFAAIMLNYWWSK